MDHSFELFIAKIVLTEMYPDISQDKDKTKVKLKFYMSRFDN